MQVIDALIALRIVYLLTVPFEQTDAFKLGLIDANGNRIKKAETSVEKSATNMLFRLVWNIKKVFALVPSGATRLGSLAAAYLLVRESYEAKHTEEQALTHFTENFDRVWGLPFQDKELVEDMLSVLDEELSGGVANVAGTGVQTDTPTIKPNKLVRRGRKFAEFSVDNDTFSKFKNGKAKYRRWNQYLNLEDEQHKQIHDFAKKHPDGIIVLKDPVGTLKGIRYSRKGSGNWANIGRKSTLAESVAETYSEILIQQINI